MRELQVNGLPIDGKFDEISTTDFAKSSDTFVLKPSKDEIFEFSAVKMEFDNKLNYKPITIKLFAHGVENAVKTIVYDRLENWTHKSHDSTVDDYTWEGVKIVTYIREFTENVFLVADNLAENLGVGQIEVQALERVEISVDSEKALTDIDEKPLKIVQGRYDATVYKQT